MASGPFLEICAHKTEVLIHHAYGLKGNQGLKTITGTMGLHSLLSGISDSEEFMKLLYQPLTDSLCDVWGKEFGQWVRENYSSTFCCSDVSDLGLLLHMVEWRLTDPALHSRFLIGMTDAHVIESLCKKGIVSDVHVLDKLVELARRWQNPSTETCFAIASATPLREVWKFCGKHDPERIHPVLVLAIVASGSNWKSLGWRPIDAAVVLRLWDWALRLFHWGLTETGVFHLGYITYSIVTNATGRQAINNMLRWTPQSNSLRSVRLQGAAREMVRSATIPVTEAVMQAVPQLTGKAAIHYCYAATRQCDE